MSEKIPQPTIIRLCSIFQFLSELEKLGINTISSGELEKKIGVPSHTIRKDISFLGEVGNTGSGYGTAKLKQHIACNLGIGKERKTCVVGLGNLGQAILRNSILAGGEFSIIAGFDYSVNRLETIKTSVNLHPAHEISEIVKARGIELAILAVPPESAQEATDRLVEGGIQGIVNFTAAVIRPKQAGVFVRNIDLAGELRVLSVMIESGRVKNK